MTSGERIRDLSVQVRIRNNQLLARRRELGLTQRELVDLVGISLSLYSSLECMRRSPLRKTKGCEDPWISAARALSDFYFVEPGDLFPDAVLQIKDTTAERHIDGAELAEMLGYGSAENELPSSVLEDSELRVVVEESVSRLHPREALVIRERFGLSRTGSKTLDEVADLLGVTKTRAGQIEGRALRRLRHPSRARPIADAAGVLRDDRGFLVGECALCMRAIFDMDRKVARPDGSLWHLPCWEKQQRYDRCKRILSILQQEG